MVIESLFWMGLFVIFYTFIGYGIVLYLLVRIKRKITKPKIESVEEPCLPTLTLIVAAYNEEDFVGKKIANTLSLEYPRDKIDYIFITDGSNDRTPDIIRTYSEITLLHEAERRGKINAIHRAMLHVASEIIVFTDANTFLNSTALINIARHYNNPKVGAVSGEKKVLISEVSDATAGEGIYWKYESKLKKWDSELYSVVGAAGELFSIRTALYQPVLPDTILDDFMLSLQIAARGYRIQYEPDSFATENSSASSKEELKRKVRIAAGGIQSIFRLKTLLNPLRHPVLSFQYISHRVLRWTVTPFLLILVLLLNTILVQRSGSFIYFLLLLLQYAFYVFALFGWYLNSRKMKAKLFFVPFYFTLMNYAVLAGIIRFCRKTQNVTWEKATRKKTN